NRKLDAAQMERTVSLLKLPGNTPARVANMLQNEGAPIQKKDIYNIYYQFVKQGTSADDSLRCIMELEDKNYHVRYSTNDTNEAQHMSECTVIDATYKMNSHRMVLLKFVGTSNVYGKIRNSLASFHIAGAWMDHESALPNVFVTDNDKALRSALDDVFPESGKPLCYIHISRNFQKYDLSKLTALYSTVKAKNIARLEIRGLVAEIALSANTEEHFKQALKNYGECFSLDGRCTDAGARERLSLRKLKSEQESLKQSVRLMSPEHEYKLGNLKGKVSKYAIGIIKQEMIASISNNCEHSDNCLCQVKRNFRLPHRHLLAKYDITPLNIVHRRWLNYETYKQVEQESTLQDDIAVGSESKIGFKIQNKLESIRSLSCDVFTEQQKLAILYQLQKVKTELMAPKDQPQNMFFPAVVDDIKGRPKKHQANGYCLRNL
ncbi:hypothetical protein CU097_002442, partial [Rhizopus azygosporus]